MARQQHSTGVNMLFGAFLTLSMVRIGIQLFDRYQQAKNASCPCKRK